MMRADTKTYEKLCDDMILRDPLALDLPVQPVDAFVVDFPSCAQ
jgi:hypothetical protein